MLRLIRTVLAIGGSALLIASRVQAPLDEVEVVFLNGPHAGTYKTPSSETICMHAKAQQFTAATWRDFDAKDPKKMSEAGIKVPDQSGPKKGDVHIAFGDPAKKPVEYSITQGPVTMTVKGKGAEIVFDGKTTAGIRLRVTARCSVLEEV